MNINIMANNTGFSFISLLEDINNINDIDTIIDEISYAIYHKIALRIGVSTIYINMLLCIKRC